MRPRFPPRQIKPPTQVDAHIFWVAPKVQSGNEVRGRGVGGGEVWSGPGVAPVAGIADPAVGALCGSVPLVTFITLHHEDARTLSSDASWGYSIGALLRMRVKPSTDEEKKDQIPESEMLQTLRMLELEALPSLINWASCNMTPRIHGRSRRFQCQYFILETSIGTSQR